MPRDFFDPTPEQQNVVLIDAATLQKAQRMIAGCEACSGDAELPFDYILDRVMQWDEKTPRGFHGPGGCATLHRIQNAHKHITEVCCVCIAETAPIQYESICDVCADRIRGSYAAAFVLRSPSLNSLSHPC